MFKEHRLTLDIASGHTNNTHIRLNTNDLSSFKLLFAITDRKRPVDLSNNTVRIAIRKPDRTTVFQDCELTYASNGKGEVVLDTQAYALSGKHEGELMIYEGTEKVAVTGKFLYHVEKGIMTDDSIESSNEWQSVHVAINEAEKATINTKEATTKANEAADYANNAGDSALTNWLEPVESQSDIETTYTNPSLGDTVQALDSGFVYRYNGSEWVYTQGYSSTALADINNNLNSVDQQLTQTQNKTEGIVSVLEFTDLIESRNVFSDPSEWDWTPAIKEAFEVGAGKEVRFPIVDYPLKISETFIIPEGTVVEGANTANAWMGYSGDNFIGGTRITPIGSGNPQRWTDIDGYDEPMTPTVVLGGNEIKISNLTVECGSDRWDIGIFVPAVKRTSLINVDTKGHWKKAGLYLDATWSNRNTLLKGLHPEIKSSSMNEFFAQDCYFQGLWGVVVQGTTRNPDDYTNNEDWLWSYGGTSDHTWLHCRMGSDAPESERLVDGGSYKHDVAIKDNGAGAGQTHNFISCSFRTASKYLIYLDRSNWDKFTSCYGETIGSWREQHGYAQFAITSNTGEISRINDRITAPLWKDGIERQATPLRHPYEKDIKMTFQGVGGELFTPNFSGYGLRKDNPTEIISYHDENNVKGRTLFKDGEGNILADIDNTRYNLRDIPSLESNTGFSQIVSGQDVWEWESGRITPKRNIVPNDNDSIGLGYGSTRFSNVFAVKMNVLNGLTFNPISSSEVSNNTIFQDSADGILKFKTSSGIKPLHS